MKLTKTKLKQIIREELLREGKSPETIAWDIEEKTDKLKIKHMLKLAKPLFTKKRVTDLRGNSGVVAKVEITRGGNGIYINLGIILDNNPKGGPVWEAADEVTWEIIK